MAPTSNQISQQKLEKLESDIEKLKTDVAKIALEQEYCSRAIKQMVEGRDNLAHKIDTTNEKLQELTNLSTRMIALFEEKFKFVEKDVEHNYVKIQELGIRSTILEKFKWTATGGFALLVLIIGWILSTF